MQHKHILSLQADSAVQPVSLADTKSFLRVNHSNDDVLINRLIATARHYAEQHTQRSLITKTLVMSFDDYAPTKVSLARVPVQEIVSVTTTDIYGNQTTIDSSYYRLSSGNQQLVFSVSLFANRVDITYKAGYGDAAEDVPADIVQGILTHISSMYDARSGNVAMPQLSKDLYNNYRILNVN